MYCVILVLLFCMLIQHKVIGKYKPEHFFSVNQYFFKRLINKNKESYFATLIHDLKTPIYAQIRTLKMLLSGSFGTLSEEQTLIIKEILNSEVYMADIVSNILTAYKCDCAELKLVWKTFDISSELNTIYESLKILAEEKHQILQINYRCSSLMTYGDKLQLTRVMTNLISNAIKYGYPNTTITIDLTNINGNITFCVKDFGEEISKDKLDKIFDKFNGGLTHYNSASTGLGLYLSKKIIQMHGGQIYAKSENGVNEFGFHLHYKNLQPVEKNFELTT